MKGIKIYLLIILVFGCAGNVPYENIERGEVNSSKKVLIAVHSSEFKNELVDAVIKELDNSIYIKTIDLKNLQDENTLDFNVIVIIAMKRVFNINRNVRNFIELTEERDKIVLFFTEAGKSRIPKEFIEIDVVSSASRQENLEPMKEFILSKIEEKL